MSDTFTGPDSVEPKRIASVLVIEKENEYEVSFDGIDDHEDIARAMSLTRKYYVGFILSWTCVSITMVSSAWSLVSSEIMDHFHISHEVSVLGISLYITGLGFGPMFLGPISEFHGRKATFIFSLSFSICFQILSAFVNNIGALMFGRFMAGFFGSAFLSVAGSFFTDTMSKEEIGIPLSFYTVSLFLGPAFGPLLASVIVNSVNWRWVFIVLFLQCFGLLLVIIFTVPETYKPVLLCRKATRLRKETGDARYWAPLEVARQETSFLLVLYSQ